MVAHEGWPYLITVAVIGALAYRYVGPIWALPFVVIDIALYFLFRDPFREVPPEPLGVLAPVDGEVVDVSPYHDPTLPGEWIRIGIDTNHLGAYTVRGPIEGSVHSVADRARPQPGGERPAGLWLRSEERHDVVLMFPGRVHALGPKTFVRYGERIGQGQRFAYLRLAPKAEIFVPLASAVRVAPGQRVAAGETILADLPEPATGVEPGP